MKKIFPSLISADLLHLGDVIEAFNPICDGFHLDIMDNHFVPNLTFGADFANAIAAAAQKPTWIHLMVYNPAGFLDILKLTAGSTLTFHIENNSNIDQLISYIKEKKWRASIAINPKTALEEIFPYLDMVDQILIMSVEPGFSGQHFMHESVAKIAPLVQARMQKKLNFTIAMDGGIDASNIGFLAQSGVDEFGVAKAIFGAADPVEAYKKLKTIVL